MSERATKAEWFPDDICRIAAKIAVDIKADISGLAFRSVESAIARAIFAERQKWSACLQSVVDPKPRPSESEVQPKPVIEPSVIDDSDDSPW